MLGHAPAHVISLSEPKVLVRVPRGREILLLGPYQTMDSFRMESGRDVEWRHTHKQTVTLARRLLLHLLPALNLV